MSMTEKNNIPPSRKFDWGHHGEAISREKLGVQKAKGENTK